MIRIGSAVRSWLAGCSCCVGSRHAPMPTRFITQRPVRTFLLYAAVHLEATCEIWAAYPLAVFVDTRPVSGFALDSVDVPLLRRCWSCAYDLPIWRGEEDGPGILRGHLPVGSLRANSESAGWDLAVGMAPAAFCRDGRAGPMARRRRVGSRAACACDHGVFANAVAPVSSGAGLTESRASASAAAVYNRRTLKGNGEDMQDARRAPLMRGEAPQESIPAREMRSAP